MTIQSTKDALMTDGLDGGVDGTVQVAEIKAVLESLIDKIMVKADANSPAIDEADGTLSVAANILMTAGWMILSGSAKAGFGGNPDRNTSAKIQAYGPLNTNSAFEMYSDVEAQNIYAFYMSGAASLYTFILRNYFNDFTISSVRAKAGTITTADREATMALVRTDDAGNEEIVDYYNQTYYASGDKIAKAMGIRMIAVGVGMLRPFYIDWKRATGVVVDGLKITPPVDDVGTGARADWAIPVYDMNGDEVLGGGGSYFESAPIAITTAGNITVTHNFGAKPKNVVFSLKCKTANLGYAVGDIIKVSEVNNSTQWTSRVHKIELFTNTVVIRLNGSSCFLGSDKAGGAPYDLANTKWELIVGVIG